MISVWDCESIRTENNTSMLQKAMTTVSDQLCLVFRSVHRAGHLFLYQSSTNIDNNSPVCASEVLLRTSYSDQPV